MRPSQGQGSRKDQSRFAGRGRDQDEARDARPGHERLRGDPRAEGETGDPRRTVAGVLPRDPVERCRGVVPLAVAAVVDALAAADAPEVEAQDREVQVREAAEQGVDHLVVHRAAVQRMGMQHDGDGRGRGPARPVAGLEAARGAVDRDFGHRRTSAGRGVCNPVAAGGGEGILDSRSRSFYLYGVSVFDGNTTVFLSPAASGPAARVPGPPLNARGQQHVQVDR